MKFYDVLLNYLTQESTYTGLLAIVTAFGVALKPELSQAIITFALGTFGLIKVIVNEKARK
jgi:hypothetical protein